MIANGTPIVNGKPKAGGPNDPHNGIMGDARRSYAEIGKAPFGLNVEYAVKQSQDFIPPKEARPMFFRQHMGRIF